LLDVEFKLEDFKLLRPRSRSVCRLLDNSDALELLEKFHRALIAVELEIEEDPKHEHERERCCTMIGNTKVIARGRTVYATFPFSIYRRYKIEYNEADQPVELKVKYWLGQWTWWSASRCDAGGHGRPALR